MAASSSFGRLNAMICPGLGVKSVEKSVIGILAAGILKYEFEHDGDPVYGVLPPGEIPAIEDPEFVSAEVGVVEGERFKRIAHVKHLVADGRRVYAYFGMVGLYCYEISGKALWQRNLGVYEMRAGWGTASSPAAGRRSFPTVRSTGLSWPGSNRAPVSTIRRFRSFSR